MPTRKRAAKKGAAKKASSEKRQARKGRREAVSDSPNPPVRAAQARRRAAARAETPGRQWHALQRSTRQSPYKMRLVIDEIRGKPVNDALAYLAFSKKHAAKQIEKVLRSAVANAEYRTRDDNGVDVDALYVKHAVINEGTKLKRFTPAAMGRATPVIKRTSHVEIVVAERGAR
jgi:large subunit ribosomal protein L22